MKMNYPLKPKPRKNASFKTATWVVGIFLCIALIVFYSGNTAFSLVLGPIAKPIWGIRQSISVYISNHIGIWQSKEDLLAQNVSLKEQLSQVETLQMDRDALFLENETLKGLGMDSEKGEVARVLSSPSQSFYDIVNVELKPNSDVRIGDTVFGPHDVVIGTIKEKVGSLAQIEYFSRGGVRTIAQLERNGTSMELMGLGGGSFLFVAPRGLEVSVGDSVVLPALTTSLIGHVQAIENIRTDSFKNVYISYPFNIFSLRYVRITHTR